MKTVLFFGDSITDMGRIRNCNHVMENGTGYVFLTNTVLQEKYPGEYKIINQGISGNTVLDLCERCETDVIALKPDILTILIGVNDCWHRLVENVNPKASKPTKFKKLYEEMIVDIMKKLPNTKIILCEPFFTHGDATDIQHNYEDFCEVFQYAKKTKSIARKYNLPFVKLQKKMTEGYEKYGSYCLYDGVHPNVVGASIISKEWLKVFKKIENKK